MTRSAFRAGLAATCILAGLAAQEPKTTSWPPLDEAESARARVLCEQLVGTDEEAAGTAAEELLGMGAGIAPIVIGRLGEAKASRHAEELSRVLDGIVAAEHAPLVEDCAKKRSSAVRVWAVGWLARRGAEDHRKVLEKASGDADAEVAFRAATGLVALGDLDRLDVVFATCNEDWPGRAGFVGAVLPPARGAAAADRILEKMPADDSRAQVTGLRLLRSLAPADYAGRIAVYLDAQQHAVKKEAINALRVIVDGEPPIEDLSVFQAIEQARKWKERTR